MKADRASAERVPPGVLYEVSTGRSGSTLLELLLACHPDIATLGEVHILPHELAGVPERKGCSCGVAIKECPFWVRVLADCTARNVNVNDLARYRESHTHSRPLRIATLARQILLPPRLRRILGPQDCVTRALVASAAYAFEELGLGRPSWVVDSSKDPYRALDLLASSLQVRLIHLVRDPRGVVYSTYGNQLNNRPSVGMGWLVVKHVLRWRIINCLADIGKRRAPTGWVATIRYEDLATTPTLAVEPILSSLGLTPLTSADLEQLYGYSWHAVAGNVMRSSRRPVLLDRRWETEMPQWAVRLTELFAGRQLSEYAYTRADAIGEHRQA